MENSMTTEIKDIKAKIGTPEEAFWTEQKRKCETVLEQCAHEVMMQKHMLKLCEEKIKEESK